MGGDDVEITSVDTSFEKRIVEEETGHLFTWESGGVGFLEPETL